MGKTDYGRALAIQERLLELRRRAKIGDILLLTEHFPVLTMGRGGKQSNILATTNDLESRGVRVYEVNRGGDVTYHGPGQIVGYPILDLTFHGRDLKQFVRNIEKTIVQLLEEDYGVAAHHEEGRYTGVWVGEEKIAAIGIAVKRWITMHGFAFNVNTNLEHFKWIHPCGIIDRGVTSLQKLTGEEQDLDELNGRLSRHFGRVFGVNLEETALDELSKRHRLSEEMELSKDG